jgi:hypothetical protein
MFPEFRRAELSKTGKAVIALFKISGIHSLAADQGQHSLTI